MDLYDKYIYEGPVFEFGRCIADRWKSETLAPSKSKALSNLIFQFKKQYNKSPSCKISLAGDVKRVNRKDG